MLGNTIKRSKRVALITHCGIGLSSKTVGQSVNSLFGLLKRGFVRDVE